MVQVMSSEQDDVIGVGVELKFQLSIDISDTGDDFRFVLADSTWLLIRFSGTEPVLRIYTESNTMARVEKLLELGRKLAGI